MHIIKTKKTAAAIIKGIGLGIAAAVFMTGVAYLTALYPTGCATRCTSAVIWLKSVLRCSPVSIMQRYFRCLASKKPKY